ncbi:MAG: hypothetical protein ACI4VQ_06470 [Clostridia bacterium]
MRRLYLKWRDIDNEIYVLATLYKNEDYYYLIINKENMIKAREKGCSGIGNMDTNVFGYKSKELFGFFKNRILAKDNEHIDDLLQEYGLKEYDEMNLLEKTKGYLGTDRYFLEQE